MVTYVPLRLQFLPHGCYGLVTVIHHLQFCLYCVRSAVGCGSGLRLLPFTAGWLVTTHSLLPRVYHTGSVGLPVIRGWLLHTPFCPGLLLPRILPTLVLPFVPHVGLPLVVAVAVLPHTYVGSPRLRGLRTRITLLLPHRLPRDRYTHYAHVVAAFTALGLRRLRLLRSFSRIRFFTFWLYRCYRLVTAPPAFTVALRSACLYRGSLVVPGLLPRVVAYALRYWFCVLAVTPFSVACTAVGLLHGCGCTHTLQVRLLPRSPLRFHITVTRLGSPLPYTHTRYTTRLPHVYHTFYSSHTVPGYGYSSTTRFTRFAVYALRYAVRLRVCHCGCYLPVLVALFTHGLRGYTHAAFCRIGSFWLRSHCILRVYVTGLRLDSSTVVHVTTAVLRFFCGCGWFYLRLRLVAYARLHTHVYAVVVRTHVYAHGSAFYAFGYCVGLPFGFVHRLFHGLFYIPHTTTPRLHTFTTTATLPAFTPPRLFCTRSRGCTRCRLLRSVTVLVLPHLRLVYRLRAHGYTLWLRLRLRLPRSCYVPTPPRFWFTVTFVTAVRFTHVYVLYRTHLYGSTHPFGSTFAFFGYTFTHLPTRLHTVCSRRVPALPLPVRSYVTYTFCYFTTRVPVGWVATRLVHCGSNTFTVGYVFFMPACYGLRYLVRSVPAHVCGSTHATRTHCVPFVGSILHRVTFTVVAAVCGLRTAFTRGLPLRFTVPHTRTRCRTPAAFWFITVAFDTPPVVHFTFRLRLVTYTLPCVLRTYGRVLVGFRYAAAGLYTFTVYGSTFGCLQLPSAVVTAVGYLPRYLRSHTTTPCRFTVRSPPFTLRAPYVLVVTAFCVTAAVRITYLTGCTTPHDPPARAVRSYWFWLRTYHAVCRYGCTTGSRVTTRWVTRG